MNRSFSACLTLGSFIIRQPYLCKDYATFLQSLMEFLPDRNGSKSTVGILIEEELKRMDLDM